MSLIKGYVEEVSGNEKNGVTYWRIKVDNVRYGTGSKQPKCKQGDYIQFEATQNGQYWNADFKTIAKADPPASQQAATNAALAPSTKPWVPDAQRQDTISYQAARKDALEVVALLVSAGALEFGAKAKANDKYEIINAAVDRFTTRYFNDTKRLAPPAAAKVDLEGTPASSNDDPDDQLPF